MALSRGLLVARHFSTSANLAKLVTPPVAVFGVEGRYAHALYSAASKNKKLDAVEQDLTTFGDVLASKPKIKEYVQNPTIPKQTKQKALEEVLKEQKFDQLTLNLFKTLIENGRVKNLAGVINSFAMLMSAHRGEIICTVTTAKPIDNATVKELEGVLSSFLKKGEKLLMSTQVDPTIIGGMVVNIGDKYVDMSMSSKIKTYTKILQEAV